LSYDVTKRIKGSDYRYRVERYSDPATGRGATRWIYLGKLEAGRLIAPARRRTPRRSRNEVIAVIAKLLESREASRVTVAVISYHVGISPGTFYRQFGDRDAALGAALALLLERCFEELPALGGPVGTLEHERLRLQRWFLALQQALRGRALRWFLTSAEHERLAAAIDRRPLRSDPRVVLGEYFRELDAAGLARIDDTDALARSVTALCMSVARDLARYGEADPGAASRWAEIFRVIERAVFARAAA